MMEKSGTDRLLERLTIKRFRRVAPSRYTAMQACLLREVWTASGNDPLLPPSPRAELGSIAHRVIEAAGRGELEGSRSEGIAERWEALVSAAEARMKLCPLRRYQVPLSRSISDFQVRRLRTCSRAVEIARDARRDTIRPPGQSHRAAGFELWVESDDGEVGGFIDCVSETSEGVVLSDYKSGAVLESEYEECPGEIKKAYRIQMLLYAALYRHKTGSWPIRLEVIPLQGAPLEVPLDPREAEHHLQEGKMSLRAANKRIAAVQGGTSDATELAAAQPEHCRLCLFRPACKAYWLARQRNEAGKWPADVRGVLEESARLRNGKVCLRIRVAASPSIYSRTVRGVTDSVDRHPLLAGMPIGTCIAVYGLRHDYRSGDYIETQNTVIYRND
ncbi:MAG: PD-(D/E)XK nuclease family protein [bacterium]